MRYLRLAFTGCLLAAFAAVVSADEPPNKEQSKSGPKLSAAEIDRLILQLGDDDTAKRTAAKTHLEAAGEPAVAALKKAAESAEDPEVRKAAKAMLGKLDAKARGELNLFAGHTNRVNGVAISADGKRAVSAAWDRTIRYWDLEDHSLIRPITGHRNSVMSVVFSPDGKRLLSGSSDQTMRLWNLESGEEIRSYAHAATVWDVAFSPDGKTALSGCSDGNARLWDVESGKLLQTLETVQGYAWTVAFTPDGKQAVTGGGSALSGSGEAKTALRLWDLATGKEVHQFEGHTKDVRRVAISRDGRQMLSASFDGTGWLLPSTANPMGPFKPAMKLVLIGAPVAASNLPTVPTLKPLTKTWRASTAGGASARASATSTADRQTMSETSPGEETTEVGALPCASATVVELGSKHTSDLRNKRQQ